MSYINVLISNTSKLKFKNNNLLIIQDDEVTIPLDDINIIVIETLDVLISSYLITECSKRDIPILFCDEKHLPVGLLNSFYRHSRQLKRINEQLSQTLPFKKQIWRKILETKILNQAEVLKLKEHKNTAYELIKLINNAKNFKEKLNIEGIVAQKYFRTLFGKDFKREENNFQNAYLNYGYAILRALIARTISYYGLIPALGVYHKNEYNNFNLADDFIEPFRPIVDLSLLNIVKYPVALDKKIKEKLMYIPTYDVLIKDKKLSIKNAIDEVIQSYITAIQNKDSKYLVLPKVIELNIHKYE